MATMRTRNDPTRLLWRRLMLSGLFALFLFASWSVWGAWRKETESSALKQQSQAALATAATQQAQLQDRIAQLQSERGREAALRQEYDVGKAGEGEIIIIDPATSEPATSSPSVFDTIRKVLWWW